MVSRSSVLDEAHEVEVDDTVVPIWFASAPPTPRCPKTSTFCINDQTKLEF